MKTLDELLTEVDTTNPMNLAVTKEQIKLVFLDLVGENIQTKFMTGENLRAYDMANAYREQLRNEIKEL